jgi:hypothetical protein
MKRHVQVKMKRHGASESTVEDERHSAVSSLEMAFKVP